MEQNDMYQMNQPQNDPVNANVNSTNQNFNTVGGELTSQQCDATVLKFTTLENFNTVRMN